MHALSEHPDLKYVLGLQEGVVVAMADGYARASGELAACNVHVAPGLGNAMGSLFNANWYGSPIIVTAGQQEQGHGLTEPLLYAPLVPIAQPVVKWAIEVTRLEDLPRILRRAAKVAMTEPTGPVFISLPGDILNAQAGIDLGTSTRVDTASRPSDATLERLAGRLLEAKRPVIISGHEVATRDALREASALARVLGAPVYQQSVPYAAHFLSQDPAFMGALSRDQAKVRALLEPYDLMIALGGDVLRMSVWNDVEPKPETLPVLQIGQRDWDIAKNYPVEHAVRSDIKETLNALVNVLTQTQSVADKAQAEQRLKSVETVNWSTQRARFVQDIAQASSRRPIDPDWLMMRIVDVLPSDAVVVEEALVSGRSLLRVLPFTDASSYFGLASGGIGFAMAGAVGIALAKPSRPVVAIVGDGSAMYSVQAMWSAAHMGLPITYLITNNRGYRILKERLLAFHGNEDFVGMNFHEPELDFVSMARGMGLSARRVEHPDEVADALKEAISSGRPNLIDVAVADGFTS